MKKTIKMLRPNRYYIGLVAISGLVLQGCAVQSFLFDTEPPRAGFVITKPPIQISYRGDISKDGQDFALEILKEIRKEPYKDYRFNENHNVRLNTIDGKSDSVKIQLIESADGRTPKKEK